jgi:multimeric flavodoxin WrbA
MKPLYVISPGNISPWLNSMIKAALSENSATFVKEFSRDYDFRNKKLIFAAELDAAGFSLPLFEFFSKLYDSGSDSLWGSEGMILVHSSSELYTKSTSANLIFLANQLGCRFMGHPVVEATTNLSNFLTWQKTMEMPLEDICLEQCKRTGKRFIEDNVSTLSNPKILVLHASSRKTSNTLLLWNMVKQNIEGCTIQELHVENGRVLDCTGCSFKTCMHYSSQSSCFYGGFMVEEIYPAIENADALVWICPNYNDALSANLTAVINRITALYRKTPFYNKTLYSIIVSGNSGSDSIARQLIDALNINKGFRLPPRFTIMETANDPWSVTKIPDIGLRAQKFAENLINEIKAWNKEV